MSVDQVDLGWDRETCLAVGAALRVMMMNHPLADGTYQLLRQAVADLDYRCALAVSQDRHPAGVRD